MRCLLAAILATGFASSTGFAQAAPAVPPVRLTQEQATVATLTRLEELWSFAIMRRDRAAFERTLSPKFIYTQNEQLVRRTDYIAGMLQGNGEIIADAHADSIEVHVFGNTGVVTGWRVVAGRGKDGPFERRVRFTDTWMPRSGSWQMIAAADYIAPRK